MEKVVSFINETSKIEEKVLLSSGRYVVDAQSVLGIYCLDFSKPIALEMKHWKEAYASLFEKYQV